MKRLFNIAVLLCCLLCSRLALAAGFITEFTPLAYPEKPQPTAPQNVEWSFAQYSEGTEYYIWNIALQKFLNDDNTLTDTPTSIWTVSGKNIQSAGGKYISVTSQRDATNAYTFTAVANSSKAATSAIEARPTNNAAYYQIGNSVGYRYSIYEQKQNRYLTVNAEGSLDVTSGTSADDNGKWLFISKKTYDIETGAVTIELNNLVDAVNAAGPVIVDHAQKLGFAKGDYAPYNGAEMNAAFTKAMQIYNKEIDYDQTLVDEVTEALGNTTWTANTEEVNAFDLTIVPAEMSNYTYGETDIYTLPLKANTPYELSLTAANNGMTITVAKDKATVTARSLAAGNISYKFVTDDAGNYTITFKTSRGNASVSNLSLMTIDETEYIAKWNPQELKNGEFLLMNKATGLFISAKEEENLDVATELKGNHPTIFNVSKNASGNIVNIDSKYGKLGVSIITSTSSGNPKSVNGSANASEGTNLFFTGDKNGYVFGNTKDWQYTFIVPINTSYTAYLTSVTDNEGSRLGASTYDNDYECQYVFVALKEYYQNVPEARDEAMELLEQAIADAKYAQESINQAPALATYQFGRSISDAEALYDRAIASPAVVSATSIAEEASALAKKTTELIEISDYYIGSIADIDNIDNINRSSSIIRSMTIDTRNNLQLAGTKNAMVALMTTLRLGVMAYMYNNQDYPDGQDLTGAIANQSFDTATMDNWSCVSANIDLSEIVSHIGEILNGDLSGIFGLIDIKQNNDTKVMANHGDHTIEGGHNKYYLTAKQALMQPLIGLPSGVYDYSGSFAGRSGATGHLSTVAVPSSALGDLISTILENGFDIAKLLPIVLQYGKITSTNVTFKGADTFVSGTHRFVVNPGDIIVLVTDAGLAPFIGTDLYYTDNLRLNMVRSGHSIEAEAQAVASKAIRNRTVITANISETEPFHYDQAIVDEYNQTYDEAEAALSDISFTKIMAEGKTTDAALATVASEYVNAAIAGLADADTKLANEGLIVPDEAAVFNITMADGVAKCDGMAATAYNKDGTYFLSFTDAPNEDNSLQLFSFERASETLTNVFRAAMNLNGDKYYLTYNMAGKMILTEDEDAAAVFTAEVSYTEEDQIKLHCDRGYMGTLYTAPDFTAQSNHTILNINMVNMPTAIEVPSAAITLDGPIYDLTGRRINKLTKGIMIQNGRKVIVK